MKFTVNIKDVLDTAENIIKNVPDIVKGHVAEMSDINDELSEERLIICRSCPLFKDTSGGLCNRNLWLNPKTGEVSEEQKDGFVRGCGCRLKAKTRLKHSKCPADKW